MPFVRIDLPASTPAADLPAVSDAVHQALVKHFNVPADDLLQVLQRRAPDELVCTPEYVGVRHSKHVVFVQIDCAPGRSVAQKQALYADIAAGIARTTSFTANDVIIHLVETLRENWSFGNGLAQYVTAQQ